MFSNTPLFCGGQNAEITIGEGIISNNTITGTGNSVSAGFFIYNSAKFNLQGGVLSADSSDFPVINFGNSSCNIPDYLELPGKTQINGTVQFKSTPDKVYYYILDEESSSNR